MRLVLTGGHLTTTRSGAKGSAVTPSHKVARVASDAAGPLSQKSRAVLQAIHRLSADLLSVAVSLSGTRKVPVGSYGAARTGLRTLIQGRPESLAPLHESGTAGLVSAHCCGVIYRYITEPFARLGTGSPPR